MDSPAALPPEIQQALARGWTILTANQRAARTLRRDYDLQQHAAGCPSWQPPAILAWESWLASLWHYLLLEGHATDLLLSPAQEHTIWRAVIAADSATSSLRPIDALARTAADASALLHAYRSRNRLRDFSGNSDTRTFTRWAAEFDRRSSRARYLTQAQLPETLRAAINHLPLPPGLLLVGFDSKTPTQLALLDTIAATTTIEELAPNATANLTFVNAPAEQDELAACARWLRTHLAAQPAARLAVIVPALDQARAEIDRAFRRILAPELDDIAAPANSGPYEFSLGVPLAGTPMVAAAHDLLHWVQGPLLLDRISALLLSRYFAMDAAPEHLARAEFDAFTLRAQHLLQPQVSLNALRTLAERSKYRADLPNLLQTLNALRPAHRSDLITGEHTHADWAATIHDLLGAANWAVPAHLDSVEFQNRRKWESALDELATLDFDGARVTFTAALASVERLAAETLFAPESRHAPIQIMGPLESAGSTFDAIWFLHANDLTWPARPSTNPLLPWQLQRELAMPGATPALDNAHACRISERIAASAQNVIFSYSNESAEGNQRPSPAIASLHLETLTSLEVAPEDPNPHRIALDENPDTDPLLPPPDSALRGGASILQQQAACAFRAFAEKRLFSSAPDTIELGLDAGERGTLIHKALELFWTEVQTQATLIQMSSAERDELLQHCVNTALARNNPQVDSGWADAYFATERQRLFRLLNTWLDFEQTRSPFALKAMEQTLAGVQIGPLHLDIRVDRIDASLVDGGTAGDIILDYKTGNVAPADWLGDRPGEPQLPLYAAVSAPASVAAVAFASIRPGEKQPLKGYESRKGVLPKPANLKADSLEVQIEDWRRVLTTLAENFHAGDARVAPKTYPSTCRNCEQRLLCRLDLTTLAADANEDFIDDADPIGGSTEAVIAEAELG